MGKQRKTDGKASSTMTNFGRFYTSFNQLNWPNKEEFKYSLILQFTEGRTTSLRGMTPAEYNACCDKLEELTGRKEQLKKERSTCLKQMQKIGIDTTDWAQVNSFCQHPRIAGKAFARMNIEELAAMSKRMRAIATKGWERKTAPSDKDDDTDAEPKQPMYMIMLNNNRQPS